MKRIESIDFMKFFAAFAVVLIHANSFMQVPLFGMTGEEIDLIIESGARFAVPFFFMAGGYFLGNRLNWPSVKKYVGKLLKLYFFWTLFYFVFDILVLFLEKASLQEYLSENWSPSAILYFGNPTSAPHLWYLPAVIWSALVLFLFARANLVEFLWVMSFALNIVGILDLIPSIPTREAAFLGLFYTTSGCLLARYDVRVPKKLFLLLPLLFVSQVIEGVFFFSGDYFFSTIFLTHLLFNLALTYPTLGAGTYLTKVGAQSASVYFLHWFYLEVTRIAIQHWELEFLTTTIFWGIGFPIILFFFSYGSAVIIFKRE